MALIGAHAPGATPLTVEDLQGLKIPSVTTHGELNAVEAANIVRGQEWARRSRLAQMPGMLSDEFIQQLHSRMFGDVWKWAGQYRKHDTNIGVAHHLIRQELRRLYDDARGWVEYNAYLPEEFAVRLHHRIVSVHPFSNGNGRHARMLADLVLTKHFKQAALPWCGGIARGPDPNRQAYIEALVSADHHDYAALFAFARSRDS